MRMDKYNIKFLIRHFVEEMDAHRFFGASAYYDELRRRGYTAEFHKRRGKKDELQ